jgi:hypothetical protein
MLLRRLGFRVWRVGRLGIGGLPLACCSVLRLAFRRLMLCWGLLGLGFGGPLIVGVTMETTLEADVLRMIAMTLPSCD